MNRVLLFAIASLLLLLPCNAQKRVGMDRSVQNTEKKKKNTVARKTPPAKIFTISETLVNMDASGGTKTFTVKSNRSWEIALQTANWSLLNRNGNTLTLKVLENTSKIARSDFFTIKSGDKTIKVDIRQKGATPYLNLSQSQLYFDGIGGSATINISSNLNWCITGTGKEVWSKYSTDANSIYISVEPNVKKQQRSDYLEISAGNIKKRISVTQKAQRSSSIMPLYGSSYVRINNSIGLGSLAKSINNWQECNMGAITDNGMGIAVYGSNGCSTTGSIPRALTDCLKEINRNGLSINGISITKSGYYCVVYGNNQYLTNGSIKFKNTLNKYIKKRESIWCATLAEDGNFVIVTNKHFVASNPEHQKVLKAAKKRFKGFYYHGIKHVSLTVKGICVVCVNGIYYQNIPTSLENALRNIEFRPTKITFTDSGTYLITNDSGEYWFSM